MAKGHVIELRKRFPYEHGLFSQIFGRKSGVCGNLEM